MATAAEIQAAYRAIYRVDLNATTAAAIASSGITLDNYIAGQLPQVASTTQAAVAIASFITGTTPTSAKLDDLKVAADAQVASYTALGVANPALGAYEAFGRSFATDTTTTAAFNTKYGALSTVDFINNVYGSVYGTTPTAAAAANLTAQITYFTNLFTVNNVPNAALAAKGAVLGQIVGYAFTSSASANSLLDNQVTTVLTSAAKGDTTVYAAKLPTVVDPGQVGVSITMANATDVVGPTVADPALKSTAFNDTITAANGITAGTGKVDGGNGDDTINLTLAGDYTPGVGEFVSVETVNLTIGNNTFAATNATGIKTAAFKDTTADTAKFTDLAIGTALSVTDSRAAAASTFSTSFAFKAADVAGTTDAASLTVNGLDTAGKSVTVGGIEILSVTASGADSTFTLIDAALKTLNITATKNIAMTSAASTALEAVTATGAGSVTLGAIASTTKTIDASGLTGTTGLSFSIADGNALTSVKASGGVDNFTITTSGKALAIDLGAGADTLVYTQSNTTAGAALGEVTAGAGLDTVTLVSTGSVAGAAVTQKVTLGSGADALTLTDTNNVVTTIVYTGSDSTSTFLDSITGFKSAGTATATAGADKIDVSAYALGTLTFAAPAGAPPTIDSIGLFTGATANVLVYDTGADLTLLIDSNKDGNFTAGTDLAIKLVGIPTAAEITAANFVV